MAAGFNDEEFGPSAPSIAAAQRRNPSSENDPSQPLGSVAKTHFLRRRHDRVAKLHLQHAAGRPCPGQTLCGREHCDLGLCLSAPPQFFYEARGKSIDGIRVGDVFGEFASSMLWKIGQGKRLGANELAVKMFAIESFITSPPVLMAYLSFKESTMEHDVEFLSEMSLRQALEVARSRFHTMLINAKDSKTLMDPDDLHDMLDPRSFTFKRKAPTAEDVVMRFLVHIEAWRRSAPQNLKQRYWNFGPLRVTAELFVAILNHLWNMDREKCFQCEDCAGEWQWDGVWQDWLDRYPLLRPDEQDQTPVTKGKMDLNNFAPTLQGDLGQKVVKDVGYFGGLGQASWQCHRLPHSVAKFSHDASHRLRAKPNERV